MSGRGHRQTWRRLNCRSFAGWSCEEFAMMEPRNRVVQVRRFGSPDELEVVDAPLPTAGRGEVRVRVLAASLEYTDVVIRRHLYPWVFRRPPFVMGYDVVGEIDQLGDGVRGLHLGDRVADMTVLGSNATYRTLRADHLTRVPAGVDAAEAAALILSWASARSDWKSAVGSYPTSGCSTDCPSRIARAAPRCATDKNRSLACNSFVRAPLTFELFVVESTIWIAFFQEASLGSVLNSAKNVLNNSPVALPPHQRSWRSLKGSPASTKIGPRTS